MGYRIISMRGGSYGRRSHETDEFYEAMEMAKEGLERVCELAEEMREQYGGRGGYGRRDHEMWDDGREYSERRRRDSRGRYM